MYFYFYYLVFMKTHSLKQIAEFSIVLLICCFPLFYRLDALALRQWDEARNAVSALEMMQNKNFIVRYFNGSPDYFDVKPPMLTWLQVVAIKFLGPDELAIRLPSALAALLTAGFLIFYFIRYRANRYAGYIAALVLVTSQGYIDRHLSRTGDHDALLVFFTTVILFLYYEFLTDNNSGNKRLIWLTMLMVFAVLTKSISVFMIVPGMVTMTFVHGLQKRLFMNGYFYISLAGFLIVCVSYYLVRESLQSGYIRGVWYGELLPRYFNTENGFNKEPSVYYIKNIFN